MAEAGDLTQAFLAAYPVDAARVLEDLPAEEVAALLVRVPARLAAPTLAAMLPPSAARCLVAIGSEQAALLLAAMRLPAVASVLRHVREPLRAALLDALPTAAAIGCRALLRYPDDAVGAWIDANALALQPALTAGDALQRVREADTLADGRLFLVDAQRRLHGMVELLALLRAAPGATLGSLALPSPPGLAAVTPLGAAQAHPVWREHAVVPVLERGNRLVGMLSRTALLRALEQRAGLKQPSAQSLAGMLAGWYWDALAELSEAAVSVDPLSRSRR